MMDCRKYFTDIKCRRIVDYNFLFSGFHRTKNNYFLDISKKKLIKVKNYLLFICHHHF